jgi:signal transduction histidine kinase
MHREVVQHPNIIASEGDERERERLSRLIVAGELVAAVAHDLRQPLTAIEMNVAAALRLITSTSDTAAGSGGSALNAGAVTEIAAALRDALSEQLRMREALQVLEDLARRREPAFSAVDPVLVVRDVLRLVSSEISARHTSVELNASGVVPSIRADATLLRQALLNILINALECTSASDRPHGPVTVSVRAADADVVEIAVSHFGAVTESVVGDDWALALARTIAEAHDASLALAGDPASVTVTSRWPIHTPAELFQRN